MRAPPSPPIRFRMKIDNECVVSVFPRWKHVMCFYYGFSSDPYDFFLGFVWPFKYHAMQSECVLLLEGVKMTWGWDVKRSCWPSWYCFCTLFLNYMCHLISFVGLVLAIVRGVAPVSTIELARKEKKVLACMCRFRSSSVVLDLVQSFYRWIWSLNSDTLEILFYRYLQVDIPKAPAVGLVLDEVSLALGIFYTFNFIRSI